jgi:hypothetical protein
MDIETGSNGLVLPESTDLYFFLTLYQGFGGQVHNELGYVHLEYPVLVETLNYYQTLVDGGYLASDSDYETWIDAIYYGDADFITADITAYHEEDFSFNYEPAGGIPLPNGEIAMYPSLVDGLLVDYDIVMDQESIKAQIIKELYDFLVTETVYNGYIATEAGALPAVSGLLNEDDYSAIMDLAYYEELVEMMPPLSLDLYHLFGYMNLQSILLDVMNGDLSAEDGAASIIEAIDGAYLE